MGQVLICWGFAVESVEGRLCLLWLKECVANSTNSLPYGVRVRAMEEAVVLVVGTSSKRAEGIRERLVYLQRGYGYSVLQYGVECCPKWAYLRKQLKHFPHLRVKWFPEISTNHLTLRTW